MGYRIVYGPMPPVVKVHGGHPVRLQVLTSVCLLLFALTVRQAWPEGQEIMRQFLLPGELTVTEEAYRNMLVDIQQGEPLGDAVTAFCAHIVENGIPEVH